MADRETLLKILELARWAPSGDNTQPWRFEIVDGSHIVIHGHDTRDWCLYDFDGHASHMAHGALLETIRIAASHFGLEAKWRLRAESGDRLPVFDVYLAAVPGISADPLFKYIEARVVQRRPMRTTPLTEEQRRVLSIACGPAYQVGFYESLGDRIRVARLLWDNAQVRLTCPEAFEVHREIIEWGAIHSRDRIPEGAVGVDVVTAKLMRWVMRDWGRVEFVNRFMFGTIAPRIQLDLIPGLCCAAHLIVRTERAPKETLDFVDAGVALQRLWLTAASLDLYLQPAMTPIIFRWYVRSGRSLSALPGINEKAARLAASFEAMVTFKGDGDAVFFCRVGKSKKPGSRSIRKGLDELMNLN